MFVCKDCGHIFYEDRAEERIEKCSAEIWGSQQTWEERWLLCPECGANTCANTMVTLRTATISRTRLT